MLDVFDIDDVKDLPEELKKCAPDSRPERLRKLIEQAKRPVSTAQIKVAFYRTYGEILKDSFLCSTLSFMYRKKM